MALNSSPFTGTKNYIAFQQKKTGILTPDLSISKQKLQVQTNV